MQQGLGKLLAAKVLKIRGAPEMVVYQDNWCNAGESSFCFRSAFRAIETGNFQIFHLPD
jgi:hypothetical protein